MATVSPTFEVTLPKEICERAGVTPGMQLEVVVSDGHMTLIPIRPIKELRGMFPGIDTTIVREADRLL